MFWPMMTSSQESYVLVNFWDFSKNFCKIFQKIFKIWTKIFNFSRKFLLELMLYYFYGITLKGRIFVRILGPFYKASLV